MEEELLIDNWLLGDWYQATDFLLLNGSNLPELFQQDNQIYEYNQWKSNDCTIYSAMGAVSDLWNYKFSEEEIKSINELSYTMWRIRGNGWYVFKAVDCVRKRWNNNEALVNRYGKIASYRLDLRDNELVDEILDKWYTLCNWYQWNAKYNADFLADGKLDGSKFDNKTYWHAVSWRKVNGKRCIKDNYAWRQYKWEDRNIYEVIPTCEQLVDDDTYYANAYLFTKCSQDNYAELKRLEQFKTTLVTAMECNSELRHLTNDTKYKDWLHELNETHRKKMKDIEAQIVLHS